MTAAEISPPTRGERPDGRRFKGIPTDVGAAGATGHGSGRERGAARLPSLTGLRFAAALLVFGFHVQVVHLLPAGAASSVIGWVFGRGSDGVSFFFILSGFVLTWSARAGDSPARFWQRRFAKIYPNHVVTWVVTLLAALAAGVAVGPMVAIPNLLLAHAWIPDQSIYFGMNSVSWSLACEAFFYALFPFLYRMLVRLPDRALWPSAIVVLGTVWLVPLAAHALPAGERYWAIWLFPVARTPEFIAGMLLARIVAVGRWIRLGVWPASALAVAVYVASTWLPEDVRIVAATSTPLALLVAAVGAADADGRGTPWRSPWAVWLGEVSFAFYLVHQLALRTVVRAVGEPGSALEGAALALLTLGLAVAASWLLYHFVERPGMRVFGPRAGRREVAAAAQPTVAQPTVAQPTVVKPAVAEPAAAESGGGQ